MAILPKDAMLLIVDLRRGFDDLTHGPRSKPDAEAHATSLLAVWRHGGRPIVHVRQRSRAPDSPRRPGLPGAGLTGLVCPRDDELLATKHVNSCPSRLFHPGLDPSARVTGMPENHAG